MSMDQDLRHEAVIERLGPLYGRGGQYRDAFKGSIGVNTPDQRLILEDLYGLDFNSIYERTQPDAPEDCGDGRHSTRLVDAMLRVLAPQNMGGSSTNALVWGLTSGRSESHLRMITGLNAEYRAAGNPYRPGGHTTEGAHGPDCGCAAIVYMPDIVSLIGDENPEFRIAHREITRIFMRPEDFDDEAYDVNLGRYRDLGQPMGSYLPPTYSWDTINLLRKLSPDIEPVNERVGPHNELAVFANHVRETRLNQDILYAIPSHHKQPFEAFGVDVWYAKDLGTMLYPANKRSQREFSVGRIMYDTAALLAITDGSIALMQRTTRG